MKRTPENIREKVLNVIQLHRADGDVHFGTPSPINTAANMYMYGSRDDFRFIISELEDEFDIELSDEIGEMTVQHFINYVIETIKSKNTVLMRVRCFFMLRKLNTNMV